MEEILREDGRQKNQLREVKITKDVNIYAEGSVLIEMGNTKVICTASLGDRFCLLLEVQLRVG